MGCVKWLVFIASFFIPVFGFITFWVLAGRDEEMTGVSKGAMIAGFFGLVLYIILATLGVTMFNFLFQGMLPF